LKKKLKINLPENKYISYISKEYPHQKNQEKKYSIILVLHKQINLKALFNPEEAKNL
jgi:hypothetical protein